VHVHNVKQIHNKINIQKDDLPAIEFQPNYNKCTDLLHNAGEYSSCMLRVRPLVQMFPLAIAIDGAGFMLYDIYPPQNIHQYPFILLKRTNDTLIRNIPYIFTTFLDMYYMLTDDAVKVSPSIKCVLSHLLFLL